MSARAFCSAPAGFAADVRAGLARQGQKELPSRYLYDDVGTALFDAITVLAEYGLTRADERLLRRHSEAILAHVPGPLVVAELGSGTGRKTRWVLEAVAHRFQAARSHARYYPIDISSSALDRCQAKLGALAAIHIEGLEGSYLDGLRAVAAKRARGERLLVLFLGSTIGNFERPAAEDFLRQIRGSLVPGDALLLGADLVKPVADLIAAYDDAAGVTAAFNLNLLARINRELGADFAVRQFAHEARWNAAHARIEMHLVSRRRQVAAIPAADLRVEFDAGETIWTESSHKFRLEELACMAARNGFAVEASWTDLEWPFAESLWKAVP
jgi:L-histidine Nalpha-methyltransferase